MAKQLEFIHQGRSVYGKDNSVLLSNATAVNVSQVALTVTLQHNHGSHGPDRGPPPRHAPLNRSGEQYGITGRCL